VREATLAFKSLVLAWQVASSAFTPDRVGGDGGAGLGGLGGGGRGGEGGLGEGGLGEGGEGGLGALAATDAAILLEARRSRQRRRSFAIDLSKQNCGDWPGAQQSYRRTPETAADEVLSVPAARRGETSSSERCLTGIRARGSTKEHG